METTIKEIDGKLLIECSSSSMAAQFCLIEALVSRIEEQLDGVGALGPKDIQARGYLQDEFQSLSERLSRIDSMVEQVPSESELAFYYQDPLP